MSPNATFLAVGAWQKWGHTPTLALNISRRGSRLRLQASSDAEQQAEVGQIRLLGSKNCMCGCVCLYAGNWALVSETELGIAALDDGPSILRWDKFTCN